MGKKKQIATDDIYKAREVVSRFGNIAPEAMSNETKRSMLRVFYTDIHGKPISEIKADQLHNIAKTVYKRAHDISRSQEAQVMKTIEAMALANEDQRPYLAERACIQLEGCNISEESGLGALYDREVKAKEARQATIAYR